MKAHKHGLSPNVLEEFEDALDTIQLCIGYVFEHDEEGYEKATRKFVEFITPFILEELSLEFQDKSVDIDVIMAMRLEQFRNFKENRMKNNPITELLEVLRSIESTMQDAEQPEEEVIFPEFIGGEGDDEKAE